MQAFIDFLWSVPPGLLGVVGYLLFFVGAFGEGLPVFGMVIPGATIALVAGFFSRLGIFDPFIAGIILFVGAVIGDGAGYYIGKKYGYSFIEKYGKYVRVQKKDLDKVVKMTHNHFGKAIIIGRFNAFVRSFVGFVAGLSNISTRRFFIYASISSFCWAALFLIVGYVLGHSYDAMSKIIGPIMTVSFAFVVFMIFGYRYVNKRKHIFDRRYLFTLIICSLSFFLFAKTSQDIIHIKSLAILDTLVNTKIDMLALRPFFSGSFATRVMSLFTSYLGFPFMIGIATLLLVVLRYKRKVYQFWSLLVTMVLGITVEISLEGVLRNIDHGVFFTFITSLSYPASHITLATIFFFGVWIICKEFMTSVWVKLVFFSGACVAIILLSFSKMFVSGEPLVRILSGLFLGISLITFTILLLRMWLTRKPSDPPLALP